MKLFLLIMSTLGAISSPSWILMWVYMEINSIIMCMIIMEEVNKEKYSPQPLIMYFITQASASSIMLMSVIIMKETSSLYFMVSMCLMWKMGVWPMSSWYLQTLEKMKMKKPMLMIMTWQKVVPVMVLHYIMPSKVLIWGFILAPSLILPLYMSMNTSIKSVLILSSVYYNSWLIMTLFCPSVMMMFFLLYWPSTMWVLNTFMYTEKKSTQHSKSFWETNMALMNMGGIPPLMMFSGKMMVMSKVMWYEMKMMALIFMFSSLIFMYNYLSSTLSLLPMTKEKSQTMTNKSSKKNIIMLMSVLIVFIIV